MALLLSSVSGSCKFPASCCLSSSLISTHSVTAITIIRINVLLNVDFTDLSYSMHHAAFWSVAEPAVAIINCCIATLRPLLKLISPSRLWSSNKGDTEERAGYSGSSSGRKPSKPKFGIEHDEYPLTCIEEEMSTASLTKTPDNSQESQAARNATNGLR